MVKIIGDRGRRETDREARVAVRVLVDLLMCHCFIWLVEFGGRVIVE